MQQHKIIFIICFYFTILFVYKINALKTVSNQQDALNYLKKFGYIVDNDMLKSETDTKIKKINSIFASRPMNKLDKNDNYHDNDDQDEDEDDENLINPISIFQLLYGLKVTGQIDQETIKKMNSPRCGLPDFPNDNTPAHFKALSKWRTPLLTYRIINQSLELKNETRRIIAEAFQYWSNVSGLVFTEVNVTVKANLTISFESRDHKDNYPFDGPGQVLAHAFFPQDGRIHFDEDETFTDKTRDGTNLKTVAIHEFGHALGLEHSLVEGSIMNPYYKGYDPNLKLGKDDIDGIQSLYGKKEPIITTTKTSTTVTKSISQKIAPSNPTTTKLTTNSSLSTSTTKKSTLTSKIIHHSNTTANFNKTTTSTKTSTKLTTNTSPTTTTTQTSTTTQTTTRNCKRKRFKKKIFKLFNIK